MTIEELREEYRANLTLEPCKHKPCPKCSAINDAITADFIAMRDTLLQVQEAYTVLENRVVALTEKLIDANAKIADLGHLLGQRTDEFKRARAEALAAGYRQDAAERRANILAEQLGKLRLQLHKEGA